jgi:adenylate kinase family enzyme
VDRQVVSALPPRLVLIGPPGSGKSTVTPALLDRFGLARIATGERLRAEMTAGSELGRAAAAFVDRGALVPDTLMDGLLRRAFCSMVTRATCTRPSSSTRCWRNAAVR